MKKPIKKTAKKKVTKKREVRKAPAKVTGFPIHGNEFWKLRSKHGRKLLFESPELMWEAACEYFTWCDNNPLKESKLVNHKGKMVLRDVPKLRAYTLSGLCLYLGCSEKYFTDFKYTQKNKEGKKDFIEVIETLQQVIYTQKFTGAACDLLNANLISRDLGLADQKKHTVDDRRKDVADMFPFIEDGDDNE